MSRIHNLQRLAQRLFPGFLAALFALTLAAQLLPEVASAVGGQISNRSIGMSTSSPGATSVTYTVNFTPVTSETHPDVIIDFCNATSDPIPGDTCSGTAGTDVPNFSAAAASGWTVTSIDSNHDIKLTTTTLSFTGGSAITPIVITGVTNPSNTTQPLNFFARIIDYANGGSSGYSSPTSLGSYVDYGGIALSTANNITINSKVYETLTFCVYQTACGTAPVLTLGGATGALSTTTAYVNANAFYNISTNAGGGATVTMTGTTLCRSATPANCNTATANQYTITSIGTTSGFTTAAVSSAGSEQFGMCEDTNTLPSGVTIPAPYVDTTATKCHSLSTGSFAGSSTFGFDDTTASGGTNNATGSTIMSSTSDISNFTDNLAFLGNIATTTEAGIYTTTLNMVATGTF